MGISTASAMPALALWAASLSAQGPAPLVLVRDITHREQREAAWGAIEQEWGGGDVLINLAGLLGFHRFQDAGPETISRILQVNLEAPMRLTRALLPGMLERRHARTVNVGSMFGSIGCPECRFARLNGVLRGVVERALARPVPTKAAYAARQART